ncbi:MAG: PAS domain S-box protein [Bacteroidales bacterium]|nr:PAS domain S-box protein [Bacteroidales bacterium]
MKELLQYIANYVNEMVYLHDEKGRILQVNSSSVKQTGYTEAELLSKTIFDMDPDAGIRKDHEIIWPNLLKKESFKTFESRHKKKSGECINVEITLRKVELNKEMLFLAIVKDISEIKQVKAIVEEKEDFMNQIFYSAPCGMIYQLADGRVIKWNKKAEDIFGISEKEIIGKTSLSFPWQVFDNDENEFKSNEHPSIVTLETGKPCHNINMKVVRSDGSHSWILINTNPIFNNNNSIKGVVVSFNDITELRRMRQTVIDSQNRIADILESIPDIIAEVNQNKIYTWGNDAAYEFFGDDFIGKKASDFFHGSEDIYNKVSPLFDGSENLIEINSWQKRQDGEIRLLSWTCRSIRDASGNVTGTLSAAKDITKLHFITEELKISEEKFSSVFHQSPIGTELYDKNGKCILINKAIQNIFGIINPDEIIGFDLFDDPNLSNETKFRIRQGNSFTYEFEFDFDLVKKYNLYKTNKNGKILLQCNINPWLIDKKPGGYFLHVTDITKQKKLEQSIINYEMKEKEQIQKELIKTKEELIRSTQLATIGQVSASISHDLKNPLGSIRNATYILRKKCPTNHVDTQIIQYINIIEEECISANSIIENVLTLARQGKIKKEKCKLEDILNDALHSGKFINDVQIHYINNSSDAEIFCDRSQLRQVFVNLIQNTIHAKPENAQITIEYKQINYQFFIRYSDNGPGIDNTLKNKIFEPLISSKTEGSGLGLTICKMIVEKHRGTIKASNGKEGGACFEIVLPVE